MERVPWPARVREKVWGPEVSGVKVVVYYGVILVVSEPLHP